VTTPTGRYKVVERDRRLVTIDTLTGQEIGLPGSASAAPATSVVTDAARAPMATVGAKPSRSAGPSPWTKRAAATPGPLSAKGATSQDWMTTLAGLMPGARVREDGAIWLSTAASYDPQGPRLVQLTPQGKTALGQLAVGLVVLAFILLMIAILGNIFVAAAFAFVGVRSYQAVTKPLYRSIIAGATPL
jgi:hypothetical protein